MSASDLLTASSGATVRTFQENLDALFGGPGIPLGTITGEIIHVYLSSFFAFDVTLQCNTLETGYKVAMCPKENDFICRITS